MTLNTIIKEIKNVPSNKLEELYQYVHLLSQSKKASSSNKKKILSYAGLLSNMSKADFNEFVNHTKKTRAQLFNCIS